MTAPSSPRRLRAQARADRIRAFEDELREAERDGALKLTADQRAALAAYHARLRLDLARDFDVDVTASDVRMSRGVRVATLLGTLAFAASLALLVRRVWGDLGTTAHVAAGAASAIVPMALAESATRLGRTRFLAPGLALTAFAGFVVNVVAVAEGFNLPLPLTTLAAWSAFAAALAYAYGSASLVAIAAVLLAAWIDAVFVRLAGGWWLDFGSRPEGFLAGGLAAAAWSAMPHPTRISFPAVLRGTATCLVVGTLVLMSRYGNGSWLPAEAEPIEQVYMIMSLVVSAAGAWIGIRRDWHEVTVVAVIGFAIALVVKYVDWLWDAVPAFAFFLIVGSTAVAVGWGLRHLRARNRDRGRP